MERQFLRIFYILFFLVGCQQVEINKVETTAKEKNLNSFEDTLFKNDEDKSICTFIQNNNKQIKYIIKIVSKSSNGKRDIFIILNLKIDIFKYILTYINTLINL